MTRKIRRKGSPAKEQDIVSKGGDGEESSKDELNTTPLAFLERMDRQMRKSNELMGTIATPSAGGSSRAKREKAGEDRPDRDSKEKKRNMSRKKRSTTGCTLGSLPFGVAADEPGGQKEQPNNKVGAVADESEKEEAPHNPKKPGEAGRGDTAFDVFEHSSEVADEGGSVEEELLLTPKEGYLGESDPDDEGKDDSRAEKLGDRTDGMEEDSDSSSDEDSAGGRPRVFDLNRGQIVNGIRCDLQVSFVNDRASKMMRSRGARCFVVARAPASPIIARRRCDITCSIHVIHPRHHHHTTFRA